MKKLFSLFIIVLLSACSVFKTEIDNTNAWKSEKNENCADFKTIKVFQTLNNGALASVCDSGSTKYCSGMTVAIKKIRNLELWDDKVITPSKDKCFTYDGTYRYESKGAGTKTVPVLGIGYKYSSKSVEEAIDRLSELGENVYFECKDHFENGNKSLKEEGLKLCDCIKQATLYSVSELSQYDEEQQQNPSFLQGLLEKKLEQCAKKYPKAAKSY